MTIRHRAINTDDYPPCGNFNTDLDLNQLMGFDHDLWAQYEVFYISKVMIKVNDSDKRDRQLDNDNPTPNLYHHPPRPSIQWQNMKRNNL